MTSFWLRHQIKSPKIRQNDITKNFHFQADKKFSFSLSKILVAPLTDDLFFNSAIWPND